MTRRFERERERGKSETSCSTKVKVVPSSSKAKLGMGWKGGGEGKKVVEIQCDAETQFSPLSTRSHVSACSSLLALLVQLYELCSVFPSCRGFSRFMVIPWAWCTDRRGTDFDGWITDERARARPTDRAAIYLRKKRVENEGFVFSPSQRVVDAILEEDGACFFEI